MMKITFRLPGGSLFSSLPKEIVPFDPLRDALFPREDKKIKSVAPASSSPKPSQSLTPINPQDSLNFGGVGGRRRKLGTATSAKTGSGDFG